MSYGSRDYYAPGEWNARCDRCFAKRKAFEMRLDPYDNARVCRECFDGIHPQLRVKGVKDDQSVPWSRPDDRESQICDIIEPLGLPSAPTLLTLTAPGFPTPPGGLIVTPP